MFMRPKTRIHKISDRSQEILDKIEEYLQGELDEPIEILVRFWEAQAAVFTYKEIREIILSEEIPEALIESWRQDYSNLVVNTFSDKWRRAISAGAADSEILNGIQGFKFDASQKRVLDWIDKQGASFVTRATSEQKEAIKVFLQRSVIENTGTDELARLLRPCVGLTKPQIEANIKFYNNVKETLKDQHPKMKNTTVERKAREASVKYAEKQHRQRAKSIAQTEIARAYNEGADLGIKQAQEQGLMGKMKRVWITSGDDKVCGLCRSLEGAEIGMNDDFDSLFGDGKGKIPLKFKRSLFEHTTVPPAHPHCGCGVIYEEVDEEV